VNEDLRARFFDSPAQTAAELQLTASEAAELAAAVEGLPQFGRSLLRKRLGEARRLLPRTAGRIGERFDQEFLRFAANRPTAGMHRHERDALAFAASLQIGLDDSSRQTLVEETGWIEAGLGRSLVIRRLGVGAVAVWLRTGRTIRHWRFGKSLSWTNPEPGAQESK
jgi:hypothetical protein